MIVRNNILKCNDNNCRNIITYMNSGIDIVNAIKKECAKNHISYSNLKGIEVKNNNYYWIFALLKLELEL